jgi:very-short-patch-repair endonuclease
MNLQDEVRSIVRREGVIARREHPQLAGAMARLRRDGALVSVLPGGYAAAAVAGERPVRLAALASWAPDAVLTGNTAAQLTFWPTLPGSEVDCALRWQRAPQPGYRFSRRAIAPELVVHRRRVQVTRPSLTALDLCGQHEGDGIDRVLRTRTATLAGLWEAFALSGGRRGNGDRRALLLDSRDQPWSAAERLAHRLLRAAGVRGWKANWPVTLEGQVCFLDIAFRDLRLVVEIDGRLHEDDLEVFENDRWRQNALVLEGWMVLRFTWRMLEDHPDVFIARVRKALRSIRSARSR